MSDPNAGPRNVNQWLSRSSFRRLDPVAEAGRFGNAGRNIGRTPGLSNIDVSPVKNFQLTEGVRLQFRAESFNVANHPNLGLPIADVASASFGRIVQAGRPRLMQFALTF